MNKKSIMGVAILINATMLTAFSCGEGNEPENGTKIQFSVIGQSDNIYSGDYNSLPEQYSIIRNNADWENLITAIDATWNGPISPTFTETDIDFSQFIIIAVIDSVYGNAGHSIYVKDITEYSENLIVAVEKLDEGIVATVITQPFQIIKIPVTDKEVIFNKTLIRTY
jgi:hypothetical protein